ncbi:unnamed protein product [Linum trigynum]|uniref:Uncharacterized protein n=1 Tax=Linum trigynum TaxID=586398 RepID=A0AAV2DC93_9ROSI
MATPQFLSSFKYGDSLTVVGISLCTAVVCEAISWILIYRLPHQLLQVPQILHRRSFEEAGDHENRHNQDRDEEIQVQEDQSRGDLAQGVKPRPIPLQVQIGSRWGFLTTFQGSLWIMA